MTIVAMEQSHLLDSVSNFPKAGYIPFACWICSWLFFQTAAVGGEDHAYLRVMFNRSFNPVIRGENCSRIDCGLRCTSDTSCNGFNFAPSAAGQGVAGLCQLVELNSSSWANVTPGVEAWLQRTPTESGRNVRMDVDANGNFFVAIREWGTVTYSNASLKCSQLGAGIASVSSMSAAQFFRQLMSPQDELWAFAGMDDFRSKSLFSDHRGLEPPDNIFEINGPDGGKTEPCLALVMFPVSSGKPLLVTDTECSTMMNPWICEFPRLQDFGCRLEPPTPLGAQPAPGTTLPASKGSKVSFVCSDPSQKFVNGNIAPTVTCRDDGYWSRSEPFYACTGGVDYVNDPSSTACYMSNRRRNVTIVSAETYCRRMGGTVLAYTETVAWVFNTLMSKDGGWHYQAFAGYMKNATGNGAIADVYGHGYFVLDAAWNDDDSTPDEPFIYVYSRTDASNNLQWYFYDSHGYTKDEKFICKFDSC